MPLPEARPRSYARPYDDVLAKHTVPATVDGSSDAQQNQIESMPAIERKWWILVNVPGEIASAN